MRRASSIDWIERRFPGILYTSTLVLCIHLLTSCSLTTTSPTPPTVQQQRVQSPSGQSITYSTDKYALLIRTFDAGGMYGTLNIGPQISLYGDGTYILGLDQQGTLSTDELQHLLNSLINTHGLLTMKRHQFSDLPDQNTTFLELTLNGRAQEFMYGSFDNQPESTQDIAEYEQLGKALTNIIESLKGPLHSYTTEHQALLVRQTFRPDLQNLSHFTSNQLQLDQIATFECGILPEDEDPNKETGCLKYTVPNNAVLLDAQQIQQLQVSLNGAQKGTLSEGNASYEVTLRPLLPDEQARNVVAMFGSAQSSYKDIPLHTGSITAP